MGRAKAYKRKVNDDREAWRRSVPQVCMYCGKRPRGRGLQVHEIERRSHAPRTWANPCNYLLVCHECHAGAFATMSHAAQLAVKLLLDEPNFCLDAWLRLRDPELKAPLRVTMGEVLECLERIKKGER